MNENWLALYLAIFKNINVSDAVAYVKYGRETKSFKRNVNIDRPIIYRKIERFSKEDYIRAIELKKTYSWKETSEILKVNVTTLRSRIKRFEEKEKEKEKAIADEPTKVQTAITLLKNSITL